MSLLQELEQRRTQRLCRLGRWLTDASEEDRHDLTVAFADRERYSGSAIAEVLSTRLEGWLVDSIREHRRGVCKTCPKTASFLNG